MKALVLYTGFSGRKDFSPKIPLVKKALAGSFSDLDFISCEKPGNLASVSKEKASQYDVFIVVGGDGTFNTVVNALSTLEKIPVLGYINFGTLGDIGKNFGVTRSLRKALAIIKAGHVESFDVGKIGDSYFAYVAAFGCYSDIAYRVSRGLKKRWGKATYYGLAAKEAFRPAQYAVRYVANGKSVTRLVPFLMVMNGNSIGGFHVNRIGSTHDGLLELFIPKQAPFNGLVQTLLSPWSEVVQVSSVDIHPLDPLPWCLDGEKGPSGHVQISVLPGRLKVFSKK